MIPCLYKSSETDFDSNNGIGKLADCRSCVVTEKRNGEYELSMTYPVDGVHADDLEEEAIILAKPSDTADPQPFRIYKITKSMETEIEVAAQHISYQLNYITVSPCSAEIGTDDQVNAAFAALKKNATTDCPFEFETNMTSTAPFSVAEPISLRSALGGVDGSVLDTFGGEYEWDRYTVRLWKSRGADNGVRIVYGKNLVDFTREKSNEDTITGVHPYWIDNETGDVVEMIGKVLELTDIDAPYQKIATLDLSSEFEEEPSSDDLLAAAQDYLSSTTTTEPNIDISVDFAQLWNMPEYADVAEAEHVSLCDTVHVFVPALGDEFTMTVTETEYDTILERYNSLTLSNSKTSSRNSSIEVTLATTTSVKSMIAMTDNSIRLSVYDQINAAKSEIYLSTEGIQSSVEGLASAVYEYDEDGNPISTTFYSKSEIDQTAGEIKQLVSDVDDDLNSYIDETNGKIELCVQKGDVRSQFAVEETSVTINTGTITFKSETIAIESEGFTLDAAGNASFSGTLKSPDGIIGGWTIGESAIYSGTDSMESVEVGTYIGTDGFRNYGSNSKYVNIQNGILTAYGVSVSGEFDMETGKIENGCKIGGELIIYDGTWDQKCGTISGSFVDHPYVTFSCWNTGKLVIDATAGIQLAAPVLDLDSSAYGGNIGIYLGSRESGTGNADSTGVKLKTHAGYFGDGYAINAAGGTLSNEECVAMIDGTLVSYVIATANGVRMTCNDTSLTVIDGQVSSTYTIFIDSDARLKTDFGTLDQYDALFDALAPLSFRYKSGGGVHLGFIYQDVKIALDDAGIEDSEIVSTHVDETDGEEYGGIAYSEIIALLVRQVQGLKTELAGIKAKILNGGD